MDAQNQALNRVAIETHPIYQGAHKRPINENMEVVAQTEAAKRLKRDLDAIASATGGALTDKKVFDMNAEEVVDMIKRLEQNWALYEPSLTAREKLGYYNDAQLMRESELDDSNWNIILDERAHAHLLLKEQLRHQLRAFPSDCDDPFCFQKYIHEGEDEIKALSHDERLRRLILTIKRACCNIRNRVVTKMSVEDPHMLWPRTRNTDDERFTTDKKAWDGYDDEDLNDFQTVLREMARRLCTARYARCGNLCYKERIEDGVRTHAWEPIALGGNKDKSTIKDFINWEIQGGDFEPELWRCATRKASTVDDVAKKLETSKDWRFPDLEKDRHVWSFQNGLFHGKHEVDGKYTTKFYPYASSDFARLPETMVASKFFDIEFTDHSNTPWTEIKTPYLDSILDYQELSADVKKWLYAFIGRMTFAVNELDKWQVIPFLKGVGGSGKSTIIISVVKKIYQIEDTKVLSNNIEQKFGLSAILDGLMYVAPEIKGNLCLEQTDFQSIVSGESVSAAVKHHHPRQVDQWETPGFLGGNEVPGWKDNGGSILRRIVCFFFKRVVSKEHKDTRLDDNLKAEMPFILQKCVRAYLELAQQHAGKDIWSILPKYFRDTQSKLAADVSSLVHFLESADIVEGPDLCIPQKEFVILLNQHCMTNNLSKPKFNEDYYGAEFQNRGFRVEKKYTGMWNGKAYKNQPFIMGFDVECDNTR